MLLLHHHNKALLANTSVMLSRVGSLATMLEDIPDPKFPTQSTPQKEKFPVSLGHASRVTRHLVSSFSVYIF